MAREYHKRPDISPEAARRAVLAGLDMREVGLRVAARQDCVVHEDCDAVLLCSLTVDLARYEAEPLRLKQP